MFQSTAMLRKPQALLVNFSDETLAERRHWIFDMDGTLTLAIHDFDEIRASLGLPAGQPILEAIAELPDDEARRVSEKLDEIEFEIASKAKPQPGATTLLDKLQARGYRVGILTRNGREISDATLGAAGLDGYFDADAIVSRDCCEPKPSPAGVTRLLDYWQADVNDATMTGDYLYDLKAGKDAGVATIHMDVTGQFAWPELTSIGVSNLEQLLVLFD